MFLPCTVIISSECFTVLPPVVDCGMLDAVENGYIVYTMGTVHQSQAMYACNHGYNLTGGDTRTCGADGSWNGTAPMCQSEWGACLIKV